MLSLTAAVIAGCRPSEMSLEPIPPAVTVAEVYQADIPREVTANGTTEAIARVTIRARVQGFLKERLFKQGSDVEKDQLLFVIDEVPFKLKVEAAKGALADAQAQLKQATDDKSVEVGQARVKKDEAAVMLASAEARRGKQAYDKGAMTPEEYDERRSAFEQAKANLESSKAILAQTEVSHIADIEKAKAQAYIAQNSLEDAKVELGYCRMYAPFAGRIGEALVKVGNLVGNNEELATIEQLDPIQVNMRPAARYLPLVRELVGKGQSVELIVQGERAYPHLGSLTFIDNTIDPTTSTFLIKATVPNPDDELLPGDYVRVHLNVGSYPDALVVPERAVLDSQAGQSVFVVGVDDVVKRVPVKSLDTYRGLRVLESPSLQPGDRVIVDGVQLVRSGQKVAPQPLETEVWPPQLEELSGEPESLEPEMPPGPAAAPSEPKEEGKPSDDKPAPSEQPAKQPPSPDAQTTPAVGQPQ